MVVITIKQHPHIEHTSIIIIDINCINIISTHHHIITLHHPSSYPSSVCKMLKMFGSAPTPTSNRQYYTHININLKLYKNPITSNDFSFVLDQTTYPNRLIGFIILLLQPVELFIVIFLP